MSGKPQLPEIERAKRAARIMELRAQGKSYRYIGAEVGLSFMQVSNIIKDELKKAALPDIEEVRKQELSQLEGLEQVAFGILEKHHYKISPTGKLVKLPSELGEDYAEDPVPVLQAIQTIRGLMERKAKMLGLDAPAKVEASITEYTEVDRQVMEWINEDKARKAASDQAQQAETSAVASSPETHTET